MMLIYYKQVKCLHLTVISNDLITGVFEIYCFIFEISINIMLIPFQQHAAVSSAQVTILSVLITMENNQGFANVKMDMPPLIQTSQQLTALVGISEEFTTNSYIRYMVNFSL